MDHLANRIRTKFNFFFLFLNIIFFVSIVFFIFWRNDMKFFHKLEVPMRLDNTEKTLSLLPRGSTIYFDKSFPEGFTRYKLYIDIDRTPLELKKLDKPDWIYPIDASKLSKTDLLSLVKDYPINKEDLRAILSSGYLSKEEIREILDEFKK